MTDATAGVTLELVRGAGGTSHPAGFNPPNITVSSGEYLFSGLDVTDNMALRVSNGTAAGTHEPTGITSDPSGMAPSDLMVYNGEVLFRGLDQWGRAQLLITDGAIARTHEPKARRPASDWTRCGSPFTTASRCLAASIPAAT